MTSAEAPLAPATTARTPPRPRNWARIRRKATPYLFLSPFLIGFVVFMILPLIYALYTSLFRNKLVGGRSFVGLDNYVKALQDPVFWTGVKNVLAFGLVQIPVMLGLALVSALILDAAVTRFRTIFRLGFFLPFAAPVVVATLIWGYLYGDSFGPVAQIAKQLGVVAPALLTPGTIIPALANISTWQFTGYNMLIMYAALQAVPPELYEAARVDGASGVQVALRIKVPLISPAIVLTFIFSIIGTLQLFSEPQVMNAIAPQAVGPNFTPNIYTFTLAFRTRAFDYSAAIAFTLALVTAALTGIVLWFVYRRNARA